MLVTFVKQAEDPGSFSFAPWAADPTHFWVTVAAFVWFSVDPVSGWEMNWALRILGSDSPRPVLPPSSLWFFTIVTDTELPPGTGTWLWCSAGQWLLLTQCSDQLMCPLKPEKSQMNPNPCHGHLKSDGGALRWWKKGQVCTLASVRLVKSGSRRQKRDEAS